MKKGDLVCYPGTNEIYRIEEIEENNPVGFGRKLFVIVKVKKVDNGYVEELPKRIFRVFDDHREISLLPVEKPKRIL